MIYARDASGKLFVCVMGTACRLWSKTLYPLAMKTADSGFTARDIAEEHGVSERQAFKTLSEMKRLNLAESIGGGIYMLADRLIKAARRIPASGDE